MLRTTASLLIALLSLGSLSSCAEPRRASPTEGTSDVVEAGSILTSSDLSVDGQFLQNAVGLAKRITYVSRSGIDDGQTEVTAAVFQPVGAPPPGGWPVVAYGHPSVGTRTECAPSLSPDLRGGAPAIGELLKAGYVVVAPDYQGLGTPAGDGKYHPYLDSTSAGYNMIDAVHAVRKLLPDVSTRWAATGTEQGGQAAWAANELAANYGWDLTLVGTASLAPVAGINNLAEAAAEGTLNGDQLVLVASYLDALHHEYPEDIALDDYRHGAATQHWDAVLNCRDGSETERERIAGLLTPADLKPIDDAATARLRGFLKKTSLPQGSAKAPMLVSYRTDDPLIPSAWTAEAIQRGCRLGDVIDVDVQSHDTRIEPEMAFSWITDRFNGVAATNDCSTSSTTATR